MRGNERRKWLDRTQERTQRIAVESLHLTYLQVETDALTDPRALERVINEDVLDEKSVTYRPRFRRPI